MALAFGGDDLGRSMSSRRVGEDDEEQLRWAAIERLPTCERMSRSVLKHVLEDGTVETTEIDVKKIGIEERGQLTGMILNAVEEDNERFLRRMRVRVER